MKLIQTQNRCERHRITKSDPNWKLIDEYCFKSKNLYNYGNYIIRQEFISSSKENDKGNWIRYNELDKMCQWSDPYKDLGSQSSQATLKLLDRNWKSFFKSIKDWSKNPSKYNGRPKMPQYLDKENGRYLLQLKNTQFRIKDGYIYFSWKPMTPLNNQFKTRISDDYKLMQCRFVPKGKDYILEVVYEISVPEVKETSERIAGIDLGINNFATITTNCGINPVVVNGKPIKSMNQYYNKEKASKQSELMLNNSKHWSNELQRITDKRNNKVEDYIHKASRWIVDWCAENNIDTLVCGYNEGWKQDSNIGKINNQNFVGIPYYNFIHKLEYKCQNVGIKFITVKESYTSGTSFLDGELATQEYYDKSRRKQRGLFISNEGVEINADVNGSYQIMKNVFPDAFADGIEGVGLHPAIVTVV